MRKTAKKIINDPVHGFITISGQVLLDIIQHPYFQRLRRISQLGLTHLVYPGAMHTRFQHAIGAMFLMDEALKNLRERGHNIGKWEAEGAKAAILLHDIGHGPFSHALENSIVGSVSHEEISRMIMWEINEHLEGKLYMALEIFNGTYEKKFLTQLISSQLDVDRMDYLRRDSFYTGVSEGVIGTQRILKMLDVRDDSLVVEEKGIYSIDNFLNSRRIMYWQVYLHKTVLSAEFTLINILKRAKELSKRGEDLSDNEALNFFLYNDISRHDFKHEEECLEMFVQLDDFDILSAVKKWTRHPDPVLSDLCSRITDRRLLKTELSNTPFDEGRVQELREKLKQTLPFAADTPEYYVFTGKSSNNSYDFTRDNINFRMKDGSIKELSDVSDQWKAASPAGITEKYYLCYPKSLK